MIKKTLDISQVEFASHSQRFIARFIDMFIVSLVFALFLSLIGVEVNQDVDLGGDLGIGMWTWALPLFFLAYEIPSTAGRGQTIGKRLMGICIVRTTGEIGIGIDKALNRFIVIIICSIIPFIGIVLLVSYLFDPKRQNIPDKVAKTFVIRAPEDLYDKPDPEIDGFNNSRSNSDGE